MAIMRDKNQRQVCPKSLLSIFYRRAFSISNQNQKETKKHFNLTFKRQRHADLKFLNLIDQLKRRISVMPKDRIF